MNASNSPRLTYKKPQSVKKLRVRPAKRRKRPSARMQANQQIDKAESLAVLERSCGRCEVRAFDPDATYAWTHEVRCWRRVDHVHHLIGGGQRGKGRSALREHKLAICKKCHDDIHGTVGGKKLIRVGGPVPLWTDTYKRVGKAAA